MNSLQDFWNRCDRNIVCGIGLSLSLLAAVALLQGSLTQFLNISGLLVVVGGVFCAAAVQFSREDFLSAKEEFLKVLFPTPLPSVSERVRYLSRLGQLVKARGVVVLDQESERASEHFLELALQLCADQHSGAHIERVLLQEMEASKLKCQRAAQVFDTLGMYAPALGLIGTILGLVSMLDSLGNAADLGPGMSVALLTTLYGAVLANLVFHPLAGKISQRGEKAESLKRITLEGLLSLAQEESPLFLNQRLKSYQSLSNG